MNFIQGKDRLQIQLFSTCLDDMIDQDNSVRVIDMFVETMDLRSLGFSLDSQEGRPSYHPADLLKLYIYGYMNKMRSSRRLEAECKRNIEAIWLINGLQPDHNTIARFRKNNTKAIKRVFHQSVRLARNFNLIGGILIAGDSTKLRAQNSKKNNYNKKKIQRHLDYINKKLEEHEAALAIADKDDSAEIKQELKKYHKRKQDYQDLDKQLSESNQKQISTTDTDSRHQIVRHMITEVSYTLQTTVDDKHNMLIDYNVTNQNDRKAMGAMLRRAKSLLRTSTFTALYDKGYHTGSEFKIADELGIQTLVAVPGIGRASQAPDINYNVEHFNYDDHSDTYICPQGNTLSSNGSWYTTRNYRFKQYKTKACKTCQVRERCTTAKQNGKIIQRSEYATYIEQNAQRVANNKSRYKRRQAIVEHPFGTIKRQWGFDHILTKKGIQRASADVGFMLIAYNLKRIMNIVGMDAFNEMMKAITQSIESLKTTILRQLHEMEKLFKKKLLHQDKINSNSKHFQQSSQKANISYF